MSTFVERRVARANAIAALCKELVAAEARVEKTSTARFNLPAGSSRAKVTTANARWSRACEYRDTLIDRLWSEHGIEIDVDVCRECGS